MSFFILPNSSNSPIQPINKNSHKSRSAAWFGRPEIKTIRVDPKKGCLFRYFHNSVSNTSSILGKSWCWREAAANHARTAVIKIGLNIGYYTCVLTARAAGMQLKQEKMVIRMADFCRFCLELITRTGRPGIRLIRKPPGKAAT